MATASDNFNRADEVLTASPNWTLGIPTSGSGRIVSNQANGNSAVTLNGSFWSVATNDFADTQETQITSKGGNYHGPSVRAATPSLGNCYVYFNHGSLQIVTNNINSVLSSPSTFTTNDVIRFRATGSTLEMWKNGTPETPVTDATYSTGQPGVMFYDVNGFLDDWSATDVFGVTRTKDFFLFFK